MLTQLIHHGERFRSLALPRGRVDLHAMPTGAGVEWRRHHSYSWDGMKRSSTPFVVIQHTFEGAGALVHERRPYALGPGTTMVVRVPHPHRYYLPPDSPVWGFFFLILTGQEVMRIADAILGSAGPVLRLPPYVVDHLAAACRRVTEGHDLSSGAASALAYEVMMRLLDQALAGVSGEEADQPDWLRRVHRHVQAHLETGLPVEALCEVAGMSRAHFVRQFTRHQGISPSEFVFQRRMELAAKLLQSSSLGISEIGARCGFAQANYFAKAFRRAFDVSPTEFRASGMYTGGG